MRSPHDLRGLGLFSALLGAVCSIGVGTPARSEEPPAAQVKWCAWHREGKLEVASLSEFGSTDCRGEIFLVGEGTWGHASGNLGGPISIEPAGTVEITLESESVEKRPLPAAFIGHVLSGTGSRVRADRVLCLPAAEGGPGARMTYSCVVPAGTSALKLTLDGFGTAFLWDLSVSRGGEVRAHASLVPGVQLFGRVETPGLLVRLSPRGLESSEQLKEFASVLLELPEGGTFFIEDVAPGPYVYRLESPSGASSQVDVVVPESARQMELPGLREPTRVRVQIQVSPQVDGQGNGWNLTLLSRSGSEGGGALSQQADSLGWAVFESLEPGDYLFLVEDAAGSLWSTRELTAEEEALLWVELEHVPIRGRASIGDEPFVGELVFGTTQGSRRIVFSTDRHGRFRGLLPSEGLWEIEVSLDEMGCDQCGGTPGTIRVPPVEVEEGPSGEALVDVAIPDTRLRGRVVREVPLPSGESVRRPQGGAVVLVTRVGGPVRSRGRQAQVWSDEEGRFEIRGIEAGQVQIGAALQDPQCESTWQTMSLQGGIDLQPVELVLEEKSSLTVRVMAVGQPVGGARVTALVDEGLSKRGATGPSGLVSLEVPRRRSGTLMVVAPGYGAVVQGFEVSEAGNSATEVSVPLVPAAGALALTQLRADTFDRGWLISERGGAVPLRLLASLMPGGLSFGEQITISGLSPGFYDFCLDENPCWSAAVFPDALAEIDLSKE